MKFLVPKTQLGVIMAVLLLVAAIAGYFLLPKSSRISMADITLRDGVAYELKTNRPVSGIVTFDYSDQWGWYGTTEYLDGLQHGLSQTWYSNGTLKTEAYYVDNKAHGVFRNYYDNGTQEREAVYAHDQLDGLQRRWNDNGQLLEEEGYQNGKRFGWTRKYYPNGERRFEARYYNGLRHGPLREFSYEGHMRLEEQYDLGQPVGLKMQWGVDGEVLSSELIAPIETGRARALAMIDDELEAFAFSRDNQD